MLSPEFVEKPSYTEARVESSSTPVRHECCGAFRTKHFAHEVRNPRRESRFACRSPPATEGVVRNGKPDEGSALCAAHAGQELGLYADRDPGVGPRYRRKYSHLQRFQRHTLASAARETCAGTRYCRHQGYDCRFPD